MGCGGSEEPIVLTGAHGLCLGTGITGLSYAQFKMIAVYFLVVASFINLSSCQAVSEQRNIDGCKKEELDPDDEVYCPGGYKWTCRKAGLENITDFPKYNSSSKLCVVDLSKNNLQNIYNYSFVNLTDVLGLQLYDNNIDWIDSDAFVGLNKLLWLELQRNPLLYTISFGDYVFSPLSSLEYLNIKSNRHFGTQSYGKLEELLQPLRRLKELSLSGCPNCSFGRGFKNLAGLRNVCLSGGTNQHAYKQEVCNIPILRNSTFHYLPQIHRLSMSSCHITKVETGTFSNSKYLTYLDISYNQDLTFDGLADLLKSLKNTSVEVLNVNYIHPPFEKGTVLKKENIEPIKYLKKLNNLYMDLNKIEVIDEEVFALIPRSVYVLTLSANRLSYGKYTRSIESMKHIGYLDLSRQHLNYDPFYKGPDRLRKYGSYFDNNHQDPGHKACGYAIRGATVSSGKPNARELVSSGDTSFINNNKTKVIESATTNGYGGTSFNCTKCLLRCSVDKNIAGCFCPPPNIKTLKWRKSFLNFNLYSFIVCLSPPIETLDMSFNLIYEWIGPIYGIEQLKNLDLASNFCTNVSSFFFDTMPNLVKLNISQNFLGQSLHPTAKDAGKHFKALSKLENLDLSDNRITDLPSNIFSNLERLKYLNLSTNMLSLWNIQLSSYNLRELDLSDNKLETLPETARNYLDSLANSKDVLNGTNNVTVYLGGNPIQCNCNNRPFLRWLSDSPVKFQFKPLDECHLQNGQRESLSVPKVAFAKIVNHLDVDCVPYVYIAVSIFIFILTIALCITVYRFRWKLRHFYYRRYRRHRNRGYDRLFDKDAFVSYASTEGHFMKNKFVPAIETEATNINLWIADRDSQAGASIAENVTHAIYSCRKTVIILSKAYLKENWCNYEMNMARVESIETNRKLFIIVLYDDVSPKEIPLDYLRLLKSEKSIEYPNHPQNLDTFWASLITAIQEE